MTGKGRMGWERKEIINEKGGEEPAPKLPLHHPTRGAATEPLSADGTVGGPAKETMGYSLIQCLWRLIGKQRNLWGSYLVFAFTCILGG